MIFLAAKLDILSIRTRDALMEIESLGKGLSPAQIILWFLETSNLEKEILLYQVSPSKLKKKYPHITKFQRVRYFFKNYLMLYRYLGQCKKALLDFQKVSAAKWLSRYEMLAENQLDLYCGDIIDRQIFIRNSYNLSIDNSYLIPIVDFLELYETNVEALKNSL